MPTRSPKGEAKARSQRQPLEPEISDEELDAWADTLSDAELDKWGELSKAGHSTAECQKIIHAERRDAELDQAAQFASDVEREARRIRVREAAHRQPRTPSRGE